MGGKESKRFSDLDALLEGVVNKLVNNAYAQWELSY
jgi:hypothetical protein